MKILRILSGIVLTISGLVGMVSMANPPDLNLFLGVSVILIVTIGTMLGLALIFNGIFNEGGKGK